MVLDTMTAEVTPCPCKGTLGTWRLQEYPDMSGQGTTEHPWQQTIECRVENPPREPPKAQAAWPLLF